MLFFAALFQAADSRRRQIADGIDNLEEEASGWQWLWQWPHVVLHAKY